MLIYMKKYDNTLIDSTNDMCDIKKMIDNVKYGEKNKYISKSGQNITIDYYNREYWYDHKHVEKIRCDFEIDKKDENLLKLIYLKMDSDDLYGNLPLSCLEYKYDKDCVEIFFRYRLENDIFHIIHEKTLINKDHDMINKDHDMIKNEKYLKKCILQMLNFVGKIDLYMMDENLNKRRRLE